MSSESTEVEIEIRTTTMSIEEVLLAFGAEITKNLSP